MHHSLTTLFSSLTTQPPLDRPAARAPARDRAALAPPAGDQGRPEEFRLPPEPRERARGAERSRDRADETRGSESRGSHNARETAPRREDPPRRSDPPRGEGRPQDGEPPRWQDAPGGSVRAGGEPPRRADPPGAPKGAEADPEETGGTVEPEAEATAVGPEAAAVAGQTGETQVAISETLLTMDVQASPASSPEAEMTTEADVAAAVAGGAEASGEAGVQGSGTQTSNTAAGEGAGLPPEPQTSQPADIDGSAADHVASDTVGEGGDSREGAEEQKVEAMPAVAEEAQAAGSAEQVSATVINPVAAGAALPGTASPTAQAQASAQVPSVAVERVEAAGAKAASVPEKLLAVHERAELQKARAETAKSAPGQALAREAGSAAEAPVKADQSLSAAFEPTSSSSQAAGGSGVSSVQAGPSAGAPAGAAAAAPNAPVRVVAEVPLGAVPVEIGLKSLAGVNHFEIRLDPAELGRIEVRLQIDEEGGVKAHLTVDKVETLALLQRDSRSLERAFEQAGLKPTDGSVDLSLRDGQSQGQGRQEQSGEQRRDATGSPERSRDEADAALKDAPPRRLWRGAAGVDVRV